MSSLLPIRSEPSTGGQEPRVVDLEGEDAEQVFSALSSTTARKIVAELHEEPRTQSEIAEELDTTVQNVRYHLDKLEDAGLVEIVDTWYSSRGNEMKVFAPADGALIVSGNEGTASRLRTALSRLVGGVAVLGMASLLLQTLIDRFGPSVSDDSFQFRDGEGEDEPVAGGGDGGGDGGAGGDGGDGADGGEADVPTDSTEYAGGDGGGARNETLADGGTPTSVDRTVTTSATETTPDATTTETAVETATATDVETATATATETATSTATATETATSTATGTPAETGTTVDTVTSTTVDATTVADNVTTTVDPTTAAEAAGSLPPGALFFLGGASVLVVVTAIWYLSGQ